SDDRDRDFHVWNAHRHLRSLPGRRVFREPFQPFLISAREVVFVGDNQRRADRLLQAATRCLQNGRDVAKALRDLNLNGAFDELPGRWIDRSGSRYEDELSGLDRLTVGGW